MGRTGTFVKGNSLFWLFSGFIRHFTSARIMWFSLVCPSLFVTCVSWFINCWSAMLKADATHCPGHCYVLQQGRNRLREFVPEFSSFIMLLSVGQWKQRFEIKRSQAKGTWVAQSDEQPDFGSCHDIKGYEFGPCIRLAAVSTEPASDFQSPPRLSAPFPLSLSLKNK